MKIETTNIEEKNFVPQTAEELKVLRRLIAQFVDKKELIPPIRREKLIDLAKYFIKDYPEYEPFEKLLAVMINNCLWKPFVASIPFNRRVLLLPKCLRNSGSCSAKTDELGLLCEQCGGCMIDDFVRKAETLGYHVIVSEGTGTVSLLLGSGQIECVIGVACLDSFERSFPLALKQAIPSIAIPLYNSDCKDSKVDEDWINETLVFENKSDWKGWVKIEQTRNEVNKWFTNNYLEALFSSSDESSQIANKWLEAGGKRLRPLIMAAVFKSISGKEITDNEIIAKLAVAVESFHKASLAHDDIADNDAERYGKPSLHEEYNVAVALNTGDLLLSYGYQLIADSGASADQIKKLLAVASQGHRNLCLGQGQELLWQHTHGMLSVSEILSIFSNKTAPAFSVAIKFGAIAAGENGSILSILENYSIALGIAFQIKDDLDDFKPENINNDLDAYRPSLILAILNEFDPDKMKSLLFRLSNGSNSAAKEIYSIAKETNAIKKAESMLGEYRLKALDALDGLKNASLKILLYRLLIKILGG